MKKQIKLQHIPAIIGATILLIQTTQAQNVSISATGVAPDNSAGLEVNFTDKGLLIPRVALTSATDGVTIPSPATSLLVYNTGTGGLTPAGYYYNRGTPGSPNWVRMLVTGTPADAWLTLGNAGTNPTTHFLGTTDNKDLIFKTNNTETMRITNSGNVGINDAAPFYKLDVTTNNDYNGARVKGTQNTQIVCESPSGNIAQFSLFQNNTVRFTMSVAPNGDYWGVARFNNTGTYVDMPLAVNRNNGFVGVRTAYPVTQLHVHDVNNTTVRITSTNANTYQGIQVGTGNGWYIGTEPGEHFVINRDIPLGNGTNVFKIYSTVQPRMSHFLSRNSGVLGNGSNNDGPTNVIIEAGNGSGRYNDWPNGWGGGISTWDICGASTYMTGYVTRSDKRYKHSIQTLSINDLLEKFMKIEPVQYYINNETLKTDDPDRLRYGFIANDIEKLFPNLVINAGMPENVARGLEYDGFIPILVKIVQEQQKHIQNQNNRIEALERENKELKTSLQQQNQILQSELQKIKYHIGIGEAKN